MNDFLMKMLLPVIMQVIEQLLSVENIRRYGDKLFDFIEDAQSFSYGFLSLFSNRTCIYQYQVCLF